MSWSDRCSPFRLFGALAALLGLTGLGGCGFAPIYGTSGPVSTASEELAGIEIAPIGYGQVGLHLREELIDQVTASQEPTHPTHRLEVAIRPSEGGVLVQPNSYVTRYNFALGASYKLVDLASNAVVAKGEARSLSSYNVVESEYATLVSKRDAESRAAETVAHDIALRLALFFSRGTGAVEKVETPPPPPPQATTDQTFKGVLNPSGQSLPGTTGTGGVMSPNGVNP